MGLGGYPTVSLAAARQLAEAQRRQRAEGADPIEMRKAVSVAAKAEAAKRMTFKDCAEAYIGTHSVTWKNAKHAQQWPATLGTYAYPVIGDLQVQDVDTAGVVSVLTRIWREKPETATRLRGRMERILDWARVSGFRSGENPARWRGHLDQLLPQRAKLAKVRHHPALPYKETSALMARLREQEGTAALALQFTILTAARTGETIGARWDEIDFEAKVWAVPAERMKAGQLHRVPLPAAALKILERLKGRSVSGYIFPGGKKEAGLSNMAMLKLLQRMGRSDLTVHGFRSTFKDWAAEQTSFPREVSEAALAHAIEDKVEAAYRRGELMEKRRRLMEAWAAYCDRLPAEAGNVPPVRRAS
jgi:integrase